MMLFTYDSYAQSYFGFKSGLTLSKQQIKHSFADVEYTEHMHFSAFYEGFRSKYLSAIGEIAYQRKGFAYDVETTTEEHPEGTGDFLDVGNRYSYLSVTLLGKIRYSIGDFVPYFCAGPRVDFKIGERSTPLLLYYNKWAKKRLYGYSLGTGLELPKLFSKIVLIEFMVSPDISDVYVEPFDVKNRSFQASVGIMF
ncbi:hypothetical protein [Zoogloea sp.]|uniref:hypothetical protein n=1 Tax=Zoogloea sp. TaxID=49181 RepID=UPI0031FC1D93